MRSCLCPLIPAFNRQSTAPSQSGDGLRVMWLLLVNVWSSFSTILFFGLSEVTPVAVSHWMVGAGLPVAEQPNNTSMSSGPLLWICGTSVFTLDMPWQRIKTVILRTSDPVTWNFVAPNATCGSLPCTVRQVCFLVEPSGYTLNEQI